MATLMRCARLTLINGVRSVQTIRTGSHVYAHRLRYFCQTAPILSGRKYTEKHEWVSLEGNIGTIGISEYAQDALGDIVYAQLPDEGAELERDAECGALESVKAASEIYSPVSGTVTAKNPAVEEKPALINTSCYDEGWLFKLELSQPDEMKELMEEEEYQAFLKSQED